MNEYSKLKSCIVGREFDFPAKIWDLSFKVFFQGHLSDIDFERKFSDEYTSEIVAERNEDLDNLAKVLTERGVKVYRPDGVNKIVKVKTPDFESFFRPSANVRDQAVIYDKTIIETPPSLRGRFFENDTLRPIFKEFYKKGFNWVQAPKASLTEESIDSIPWEDERDFENIPERYEMFFDAANMLKFDDFVLYNYSSYNHFLGIEWLKHNMPCEVKTCRLVDNHIDGVIASLAPGVILVNNRRCLQNPATLKCFEDYKVIYLPDDVPNELDTELDHISSPEGMSINVLSIDEKTVLVNTQDTVVADLLDKNGFNVIPVQLRYCTAFGGGLHCSTLDLERE